MMDNNLKKQLIDIAGSDSEQIESWVTTHARVVSLFYQELASDGMEDEAAVFLTVEYMKILFLRGEDDDQG